MRRDEGHLQVLEAMLVTLVLLGSIFAVMQFRLPANPRDSARASIQDQAVDALVVLQGLGEDNGTALELALAEALHCRLSPAPPQDSCLGARGRNLSLKLDSYLPHGAAYMVGLGNGGAVRELWRDALPIGEAVEAKLPVAASWNLTFVAMDLSCHEPGADANATLVPIRLGNLTAPSSVKVNMSNGVHATAEPGASWGLWNVTLPGATRPAAGVATAMVQARGATFPGAAGHAACALEGLTPTLRAAVQASRLDVTGPWGSRVAPVAGQATFHVDVSPLAAVAGAALGERNVTIYEPLPPRPGVPDAYAPLATVPLAGATADWTVPPATLYGAHPVLLRQKVSLTLPSAAVVDVEARLVGILEVGLPAGIVPLEPPYEAVLQVWFPDWH